MAEPKFIEIDSEKIVSETVARYEELTGKTLQPAQPERLVLNANAYRELLVRQAIQDAALQNLVEFSSAPVLDYLGDLVGVKRLPANPATTVLRFTLVSGHGAVTVPQGTRVSSVDGKVVFVTIEALNVSVGVNTADVDASCVVDGVIGNGYLAGQISTLLDPQAFIVSVENTNTTAGAADEETDGNLRERIKLAPASFSTAGPSGAYKYWAKTANASIIDVGIGSNEPGTVQIYPLMADGNTTPTQVLEAVEAICSDEKIRPLCDTVTAVSPTRIDYSIVVEATLYTEVVQATVEAQIQANLEAFTTDKRLKIGNDIIVKQVIKECMVDGVYNIVLKDADGYPFADIIISDTQFGFCNSIEVDIIGTTNG